MAAILVAGWSLHLHGQAAAKPSAAVSTLPAVSPTAANQAGVNRNGVTAPPAVVPHHIEVSYNDGKLAVDATNAGLNEILREVAQKTGMKITGSVVDDRVFGVYGPSKPVVVLDALLEGSGSNMLLVDDANGRSELILTARRGGVTPPNPNATPPASESDDSAGQYVPPVRPYLPPTPNGRSVGFVPNQDGSPAASQGGEQGDGPKTPQQIYDQLQRTMQQQKQAPNAPPQ